MKIFLGAWLLLLPAATSTGQVTRSDQRTDLDGLPVVSVTVEGLRSLDEDVLLRRMDLRVGSPWSEETARRDERAISGLAFLWSIRVEGSPALTADPVAGVDVRVAVEERFVWFVVPQVDWTAEEGWSWGLAAGHLNLRRRGHRLFMTAMAGGRRHLSLTLLNPWTDDRHGSFAVGGVLVHARNRLYGFEESGERVTGEWGRWVGSVGRFRAGLRYQRVRSDRAGVTTSSAFEDQLHLGWITFGLDTTDPWAYPRLGVVAGLTGEYQGGWLGGDLDGASFVGSATLHHPLGNDLVGALMARWTHRGGGVPLWRHLALGGPNTIRGYPLGSWLVRAAWDASVELQWYAVPMRRRDLGGFGEQILGVSLSLFGDAGAGRGVRAGPGIGPWPETTPTLLSWGAGATFHNAMFGNLRLEVAWPDHGGRLVIFRIGSKL